MTETMPSLRGLFASAEDRQRKLEAGLGGAGENGQHQQLRLAIDEYEACRQAVEELALFSPNETVDDISSENLRCVVVPFLPPLRGEKGGKQERPNTTLN